MTSRRIRQAVSLVRRLSRGSGVPEAELGERLGGSQEGYRRVLTRAVTQGYLMRKNHKYYFIPTEGIQLPSLVVMRRKARRGRGRRGTGRGRSRRRSAGLYLEAVMTRSRRPARRRRRARRHAAVALSAQQQQQVTARPGAQNTASETSTPQKKEEQTPP